MKDQHSDNPAELAGFPVLKDRKVEFEFDYRGSTCDITCVHLKIFDRENMEYIDRDITREYFNLQTTGRWREDSRFIGKYQIVRELFDWPSDVSESQIYAMEGYVEMIGKMIDDIVRGSSEAERVRREKEMEIRAEERRKYFEKARQTPGHWWHTLNCDNPRETHVSREMHVYLMRHANGLTKIGRSVNPKTRERTLQAEDPRLRMIFKAPATEPTEKRLHEIYAPLRVRGEWFRLNDNHVDWIKLILSKQGKPDADEILL